MTRIRQAAAQFIEAGRVLGHLERLKSIIEDIDGVMEIPPSTGHALAGFRQRLCTQLEALDHEAVEYRLAAERLIAELEHPGAAFGRRMLAALAAARAAWRG